MELKEREQSPMVSTSAEAEDLVATRPVPIKGRRRNLGRQARKRRKKYLEIEAAASAFVSAATSSIVEANENTPAVIVPVITRTPKKENDGDQVGLSSDTTTTTVSKTTVLPTDRGYVLDDVRRRTVLSQGDRRDLIRQLGYLPGNALRVVARVEDAFSSDDLQRLFVAAAIETATATPKAATTSATRGESVGAADAATTNGCCNLSNISGDQSTIEANGTTNDRQTNERREKMMSSMIQTMMKEPLVIKLYPLVLRDESSSTKRRRKRRREETKNDYSMDTNGTTTTNATLAANASATTSETGQDAAASSATGARSAPLMEPFPTIYWVTHPLMKALISKLELDRVNVQFEQRLLDKEEQKISEESYPTKENSDSGIGVNHPLASMKRAHKSYGKERRDLLSSRDMEYVKGRRWCGDDSSSLASNAKNSTAPFSDGCGVAGIRNPKGVKCLHAHAAHYWSGNSDNVVGRWVWERLKSGRSFFRGSSEDSHNDGPNPKVEASAPGKLTTK